HVLRRARDLLDTATRGAVHFPRQVIALFTAAVHPRNRSLDGALTLEQLQDQRAALGHRLAACTRAVRAAPADGRLARHRRRQPAPTASQTVANPLNNY